MFSLGQKIYDFVKHDLDCGTILWHHLTMKRKYRRTMELVFKKPVSGNVKWEEVVAMLGTGTK